MKSKQALLIVDVQIDFCPQGALAVPEGNKIVPALNKYINVFKRRGLPIIASRDWHPKKTSHFKKYGGLWPVHCVQRTKGARFNPKLRLTRDTIILSKGMNPKKDSYSAFQAYDADGVSLNKLLKKRKVNTLFIGGLATDYCVKTSVLDALKKGYKVNLLMDAIRGVDINKEDSKRAIEQMIKAGAKRFRLKRL